MKGLRAIIAGAGAISVASLGVFGASNANAAAAVSLADNPESASSITITHDVPDAVFNVTGTFTYKIEKCGLFPDLSNPEPIVGLIDFRDVQLDMFRMATVSTTVDLSDLSFGAAGTYEFCVSEIGAENSQDIDYDRTTEYKFYVDVLNEKNDQGEYTGELKAVLSSSAVDLRSGYKGEIKFTSRPELTYIEVAHEVRGDKANLDQYFGYTVKVDEFSVLPQGYDIPIEGIDDYYIDPATGERKRNPSSITAGQTSVIYLKHGQTIELGASGDNNFLPKGIIYSITTKNDSELERLYSSQYDGFSINNSGMKRTVLRPGENATEEQIAEYNNNSRVEIVRSISGGVSTGIMVKVIPFVALLMLAGIATVSAKLYAVKNKKSRV